MVITGPGRLTEPFACARTMENLLAVRFEQASANHLGYPYNLKFGDHQDDRFGRYLINNLGDPGFPPIGGRRTICSKSYARRKS